MSYIINNSRGQVIAVVPDGTINTTSTSLALVGRGVNGYGESENENYVFLLENFASPTAPQNAIAGQLWFNSSTNEISVYSNSNTWQAVPTEAYVQAQKISPIFTGIPQAPTATTGTATTQIATTAFVTLSPAFSGVPTAPTATAGTATTQLATTEFVSSSPQFLGTPRAPTADSSDNSTILATTAFVQAQKISPQLTGTPTAPTAAPGTASDQLATTAFVTNGPQFTGVPTAPTAAAGTANTQIATTAFVTNSPRFSGVPLAPTAALGTANTQIATTAFVSDTLTAIGNIGSIAAQNASNVAITGGTITGITPLDIGSGGTGADNSTAARTNLGLGSMATQSSNSVNITGGEIQGIIPLGIFSGGTGASTAAGARSNLGLGSLSVQNSNQVSISGGSITGITDLAVADGGTGASTPAGARASLGIGSMGAQESSQVAITGGSISGITLSSLISPLAVNSGGTGAVSAGGARSNLGLGNMSLQNSESVIITGGSISNIQPLPVNSGGTGANNPTQAMQNLLPVQSGNAGRVLSTDGNTLSWITVTPGGGGSVVSVSGQGSANGLTLSGTVTSSGAITLGGEVNNISAAAITSGIVAATRLGTGIPNSSVWLRGDNTWQSLGPLVTATVLPVINGGTGAFTIEGARSNLGLGTMSQQNANSVLISGGNVNGVTISNAIVNSLSTPLSIGNGGTSSNTPQGARNNILPLQSGNTGMVLTTNGTDAYWGRIALGEGMTEGILPLAAGGTAANNATQAARNILPNQAGQAGKLLATDGTNIFWSTSNVPSVSGQPGKYLATDGITTFWNFLDPVSINGAVPLNKGGTGVAAGSRQVAINALLPAQSGQSGRVLSTDGSNVFWATSAIPSVSNQGGKYLATNGNTSYWDFLNPASINGAVPLDKGGTGVAASSRQVALNALLPSQIGQTGSLQTNGSQAFWGATQVNFVSGVLPLFNGGTGIAASSRSEVLNALLPPQSGFTINYVLSSNFTGGAFWRQLPTGSFSTLTYGNAVNCVGFTNIVGGFSNASNYFDVFPPSGKTMGNLVAFMPSIAYLYYAGVVNGDDSTRCVWTEFGDRVRVYVQNTEQRATPAGNYLAFWS